MYCDPKIHTCPFPSLKKKPIQWKPRLKLHNNLSKTEEEQLCAFAKLRTIYGGYFGLGEYLLIDFDISKFYLRH